MEGVNYTNLNCTTRWTFTYGCTWVAVIQIRIQNISRTLKGSLVSPSQSGPLPRLGNHDSGFCHHRSHLPISVQHVNFNSIINKWNLTARPLESDFFLWTRHL